MVDFAINGQHREQALRALQALSAENPLPLPIVEVNMPLRCTDNECKKLRQDWFVWYYKEGDDNAKEPRCKLVQTCNIMSAEDMLKWYYSKECAVHVVGVTNAEFNVLSITPTQNNRTPL